MIKRILVVSLALLLCVPLLAATVFAATQYHFSTTLENSGIYSSPASEAPPPGLYRLDGVIHDIGLDIPFSVEINVFYEYEGDSVYGSILPFVVVYNDVSLDLVAVFALEYENFVFFVLSEDENYLPGDFTLTQLSVKPPLHVLLETIGTFLRYTTSLLGFVVGSLISPDGAFYPLWSLIGMCVAFALVPAGIALINRFRP